MCFDRKNDLMFNEKRCVIKCCFDQNLFIFQNKHNNKDIPELSHIFTFFKEVLVAGLMNVEVNPIKRRRQVFGVFAATEEFMKVTRAFIAVYVLIQSERI